MEIKEIKNMGFWGGLCTIVTLGFAVSGFISFVVFVSGRIFPENRKEVFTTATTTAQEDTLSVLEDPCASIVFDQYLTPSTTPFMFLADFKNNECYEVHFEKIKKVPNGVI